MICFFKARSTHPAFLYSGVGKLRPSYHSSPTKWHFRCCSSFQWKVAPGHRFGFLFQISPSFILGKHTALFLVCNHRPTRNAWSFTMVQRSSWQI